MTLLFLYADCMVKHVWFIIAGIETSLVTDFFAAYRTHRLGHASCFGAIYVFTFALARTGFCSGLGQ
ncbi:MAG: hypothetical protein E3J69_00830 [Anaerolineales bacterium]|nr:MAG: hypothetical protein E3J69_00830 [Anaerolineales bacterium]